ncbi:MAG TPA: phosphopantothenoylcysteine decarboxylase, partial [Gemmata sp.]|nr:phosphopantothenoylcysteine decarboxylase [Gemmata sp.]
MGMNVLVTAGNTQTPVDRVRCITNIFSGRTGGQIAARAYDRGHAVTLLTSHPEVID